MSNCPLYKHVKNTHRCESISLLAIKIIAYNSIAYIYVIYIHSFKITSGWNEMSMQYMHKSDWNIRKLKEQGLLSLKRRPREDIAAAFY